MVVMILFFTMMMAFTFGGLFVVRKEQIKLLQIIIFIIIFLFLCYIGKMIGIYFAWSLSAKVLEYLLAFVSILFVLTCMTRIHRPYHFFYSEDRILLILIICLFLFTGLQWGLLELGAFFMIVSVIIFALSLMIGMLIQLRLKQRLWRYPIIHLIPFIWICVASILRIMI